ncbi:MAG: outer membrane lipoprotein-sorting protein [Pseudomonadota bacterium]
MHALATRLIQDFRGAVLIGPVLLAALLLSPSLKAGKKKSADNLTGKQIIERINEVSGLGVKNGIAKVKMILQEKNGGKRERVFIVRSKETGGLRKTVLKFLSPADVMGTGLLLLEKSKGNDDQYLYLPETGKARKVAGKQRSSAFLSSDFLYWDLRSHAIDDADHERLPDETVSGMNCMAVKTMPREDAEAPYGKIITWVAVSNDVPVKMEFYDGKDNLVKKLFNSRIEKKEGTWVIMESGMTTVKSGHQTKLIVQTIEFKDDISDDEFTKNALKRVE